MYAKSKNNIILHLQIIYITANTESDLRFLNIFGLAYLCCGIRE